MDELAVLRAIYLLGSGTVRFLLSWSKIVVMSTKMIIDML